MVYQEQLEIATTGHGDMCDISAQAQGTVRRSEMTTGILHLFHLGSTGALGALEFEPGLAADLPAVLDRLIPRDLEYGHEQAWHDGNGHSHLQATLLGPSITIPVADGRLVLGTWQQIVLLECDVKPRSRTVVATVIGQ